MYLFRNTNWAKVRQDLAQALEIEVNPETSSPAPITTTEQIDSKLYQLVAQVQACTLNHTPLAKPTPYTKRS